MKPVLPNAQTQYTAEHVQSLVDQAYEAGMKDAVPEGWKAVPMMPTPAMFSAAIYRSDDPGDEGAINNWDAMLEASPDPEGQG